MVAQGRRFAEEELWLVARQLFSALSEAQEHGVPVNNLRAANIHIDLNNDY